jgi:hypothetical protein
MAKAPTRVTLGRVYEDSVSGFVGAATARYTTKNGCVMVALNPRVDEDGKMLKAEFIFETQLIDQSTSTPIDSKPDPKVLKLLGKRYVDEKTGFGGYAAGHSELLNGTEQLDLTAPVKADGSMGDAYGIDVQDLKEQTSRSVDVSPPRGAANRRIR